MQAKKMQTTPNKHQQPRYLHAHERKKNATFFSVLLVLDFRSVECDSSPVFFCLLRRQIFVCAESKRKQRSGARHRRMSWYDRERSEEIIIFFLQNKVCSEQRVENEREERCDTFLGQEECYSNKLYSV